MADIVFVVDDTGSMGDDIEQVKDDIDYIVDRILENITSVRFGLVTYKDQNEIDYDVPLTFDVEEFKQGVWDMIAEGGGDYPEAVKDALETARDSSDWRDPPVVRIMILIGDADPHDPPGAVAVADDAYTNFGIYTCVMDASPTGLQSFVDIVNAGHGMYEDVGNKEQMAEAIINAILFLVPPIDLAGEDIDQTDSDFMIQDVLPEYIHYVPGSFSIPPDIIYTDSENRTVLQWNVSRIRIGQIWRVSFSITSSMIGLVDSNDYFTSRVHYSRWDNSTKTSLFPRTQVLVKLGEPQPPELFIDVIDDLGNIDGRGKHIRLTWIHSNSRFIDHYLVYRSENQKDFDFSTPWVRTDTDSDNGINPMRNSWNDTLSAEPGNGNYNKEWYYVIRSVDIEGKISHTSRTVGKWTKQFLQGTSTFSLPLQPLKTVDTDYYTTDMGADYIKWMDPVTHIWNLHNFGDGIVNNTDMIVGEGYEVYFSASTDYTFTGLPGAMIKYDDTTFSGFDWNSDAKSLTASVDELSGDVTLNWARPSGMSVGIDYYYVYYSVTRDGFWGLLGVDYHIVGNGAILTGTETVIHLGAVKAGTQFYYMIVPVQANGLQIGASTYSIGVWTEEYLPQYDSCGIPLKLSGTNSADWYCENTPDTVGMNYYLFSGQRWGWHSTRMPTGAYDPDIVMAEGYQISTTNTTKYTFIGI
jgi:hypothetical protein